MAIFDTNIFDKNTFDTSELFGATATLESQSSINSSDFRDWIYEVSLSGTSSISSDSYRKIYLVANLIGEGILTSLDVDPVNRFQGVSAIVANAIKQVYPTSSLSAVSNIIAGPVAQRVGRSLLEGESDLSAIGFTAYPTVSSLSGQGSFEPFAHRTIPYTTTLLGTTVLSSTTRVFFFVVPGVFNPRRSVYIPSRTTSAQRTVLIR